MSPTDTKVPPLLANALAATPSPMIWRALALVLDSILAGTIATIILTTLVFPQNYPNAEATIHQQMHSFKVAFAQANTTGKMPEVAVSQEYLDLSIPATNTLFLVLLVYFTGSELVTGGSTLGKRVFSLRAARCWTAEQPTWLECFVRNIFKVASLMWIWLLAANVLTVLFRPGRRAIHDYLARTVVTGDPAPPRPVADGDES
jgi:uncharacterized RDD family membrane protein YckC